MSFLTVFGTIRPNIDWFRILVVVGSAVPHIGQARRWL